MNTEMTESIGINGLPAWVFMWLIATAIFAGAKWLTIPDGRTNIRTPGGRTLAYLFLWPGLNFRAFSETRRPALPTLEEWVIGAADLFFGAAILWGGLRFIPPTEDIFNRMNGMVGIVFVLHFGLFRLLSNIWRAMGVNAPPLMMNPIRATSLAGFWGGRWNKAFNDLMVPHVFEPVSRKFGTTIGVLGVFLVSGLLHEAVISVPARGGFGLPTLYFTIQAAGLLLERSAYGRKARLGHGIRGWLYTAIIAGGPAYWLFHPIFVRNVILPMLRAIGAI